MLFIRKVSHLLAQLGISLAEANKLVTSPESFYETLFLYDPRKPGKTREVVNVCGLMRRFQERLYRRVLLPKLAPAPCSHGGVPGRSTKTNARPHLGSSFIFKTDISDFYPSVHFSRIYKLFTEKLICSADVSHICTKTTTYSHKLALGLITSPILANAVMRPVDERLSRACAKAGLAYTRYVDDITISGAFDLGRTGFPKLVVAILGDYGFSVNAAKHQFGRLSENLSVTGLRERCGRLDVTADYFSELTRQLRDAASLARGGAFDGPYYTRSQILGRLQYVCWVNPARKKMLLRSYRAIQWDEVKRFARIRGYEECRKVLSAEAPRAIR